MKIIYLIILSTFIISCSNNNTTNTSTTSEAPVVETTGAVETEPEENNCSVCSNKKRIKTSGRCQIRNRI